MVREPWRAIEHVDALLAQLQHDELGVRLAVEKLSIEELAEFRQELTTLSNTLYDVASVRARERAGWTPPPLPTRFPR